MNDMDILVKKGVENKYWIHSRRYSKRIYESYDFKEYKGEYSSVSEEMFRDLLRITTEFSEPHSIDLHHEVILELLLSLNHLASNLIFEETLINSLPVIRLFIDNIARYYAFDRRVGYWGEELVASFDKKQNKNIRTLINYNEIFSKKIMSEYHYSGAENHFGSLFNRNMEKELQYVRKMYILGIYKTILLETIEIMADIVVKIAMKIGKKSLALFEQITLIYSNMGLQIIALEASNE